MAEGPPLDSYSPDTLERIVDGVLQLENSQRSLMELEDDIFGFCVKAFLPTEEGEVGLDVGDRVKLMSCEALPNGQGVYNVVNLRTNQKGRCPVDILDFCDGVDDIMAGSSDPSPVPVADKRDRRVDDHTHTGTVSPGDHTHQDPSTTREVDASQLLARSKDTPDQSFLDDGRGKVPPSSVVDEGSGSTVEGEDDVREGEGPHRSRGITLVRRPNFKMKSKPIVDTSNVEANVVGFSKDQGEVSFSADCDFYGTQEISGDLPQRANWSKRSGVVVEPSEEVLSLELKYVADMNIFTLGGFDKESRPVIVVSACNLPESYKISHDILFSYALIVLDKYVENDYTIVYFHHGLTSSNKPDMKYLRQAYKEMNRKYKKNLKKLYIVHPSNFVKLVLVLMKPFLSVKFGRKIVYVNRLSDLEETLYLDQISIPEAVKRHDATLTARSAQSSSVFHKPTPTDAEIEEVLAKRQFGAPLAMIHKTFGGEDTIPPVVRECVRYLEKTGLEVVGIFRRSAGLTQVLEIKKSVNRGNPLCLADYDDPHIAAVLLKMFLRDLPEPLLTFPVHGKILEMAALSGEDYLRRTQELIAGLPELNYSVLKFIMALMTKIIKCTDANKMTTSNLAIVLGPNLVWSKSEVATLANIGAINNFVVVLINHFDEVFIK
jgi:Rho GTPase-activating protein 1